jgi:putative protease
MEDENIKEIGKITHFFDKINVAVVELTDKLKIGDKIRIKGATTDFEQPIKEMQIEHDKVEKAGAGDAIGLKVKDRVRIHDKVYLE